MNKTLFLLLSFLASSLFAPCQTAPLVSMNGISDLKINMTKAEVEQLTGAKIKLKNLPATDEWTRDTIPVTYKGIPYSLMFEKQYVDDKTENIVLAQVYSSSNVLKTPSGVVIGDDVCKIIGIYKGYSIMIYPEYENNYTVKSKTLGSCVLQSDETSHVIIFHLNNNAVAGFSVTVWEGD